MSKWNDLLERIAQRMVGRDALPIELTGSTAELASTQASLASATATTFNRAVGASKIEVYVESGNVRVRTDGLAATATTGEPVGEGFMKSWEVACISVYAVDTSTVTVVSR